MRYVAMTLASDVHVICDTQKDRFVGRTFTRAAAIARAARMNRSAQ